MVFSQRLRRRSAAIAQRWLTAALAAYPADSVAAFRREQNRFANPLGHALRVGTAAALEALLEGRTAEEVCSHLDEIVRMRAVQEFPPSRALEFLFALKDAVRAELGSEVLDPDLGSELTQLDRHIDRVALSAWDLYVGWRSRVYELRINEIKRTVSAFAGRTRGGSPQPDPCGEQCETSICVEAQRGDER